MSGSSGLPSSVTRNTNPSTGLSYLSYAPTHGATANLYIFIHGWGCTALDYLPLIQSLTSASPNVQYVAIDLPGHGESPSSLCPISTVLAFAALVNRLCHEVCTVQDDSAQGKEVTEELAEKLSGTSPFPALGQTLPLASEIERVIIGHSMGCRIALEAFSQEPENVSGVVLLDGSWYGHSVKTVKPVQRTIDEERKIILRSFETMFGPAMPNEFRQQVTQQFREIGLVYALQLSKDYLEWDWERMDDVSRVARENKRSGGGVTKVLVVVQGTEGRGATRRSLEKAEETSWMRLVRERVEERYTGVSVEDSGHWPHVDKTDEVAQAIEDFANKR